MENYHNNERNTSNKNTEKSNQEMRNRIEQHPDNRNNFYSDKRYNYQSKYEKVHEGVRRDSSKLKFYFNI